MSEDSKIIELFYAREEKAIVELSQKYGSSCKRLAKNILQNDLDAEECVNDTYLAAWNTIPPQNPQPLSTYIFRIVRNIASAKYHKNTAIKRNSYYDTALEELEGCIPDSLTVEEEIEANELSRRLDIFLGSLDTESRVIFVRRYWFSEDVREIAKSIGTTADNISVRLFRIRKKLSKYLAREGFEL